MKLPKGPKHIHVNPTAIKRNAETRTPWSPVCVVRYEDKTRSGYGVEIHGPSKLVYEPERNQGATVRLFTEAPITIDTDAPNMGS